LQTGATAARAAARGCRAGSPLLKYVIIGNAPAGVVAAETLRRADPA
jgi:hypothetical protein